MACCPPARWAEASDRGTASAPDVLVVGAGPAGRVIAASCAERGLRTELIDPAPNRPWRATYGGWLDELPAGLPAQLLASTCRTRAIAVTEHTMDRRYVVFDVPALRRHLDQRLTGAGVTIRRGRAGRTPLAGTVVIDAAGPAQPLSLPTRRRRVHAEQTAFGVVVPAELAAPLIGPGQALFMDWRPIPGLSADPATFLYAVPLGPDRVLLEETSLARRPGLAFEVLATRLRARLAGHGIRAEDAPTERVRFPLDLPRHRGRWALGFGAAAPLTHPATGYQLAGTLRLADPLADALAAGIARGGQAALRAGGAVLWPPSARATQLVRRRGLESLLRLPPGDLRAFFEGFFRLPESAQRDFLSERTAPVRTCAAMAGMLRTTDWRVTLRLIGSSTLVSAPPESSERTNME
ncbi:MAG TPA: lycopene cyclase family protein [Pseudonocardia sp.]